MKRTYALMVLLLGGILTADGIFAETFARGMPRREEVST